MTKILNIDHFAQVKRQLSFKGKLHDVLEVSVQQFIDNLKAAEELEASGQAAEDVRTQRLSAAVETSVEAVMGSIPTLDEADLRKLPVEALHTILRFIRGEMDPDEASAPAAPAAAAEGEGPKAS